MSWAKGADVIEDLLGRGHLERVQGDPAEARYLLERAGQHLQTAEREAELDPEIALRRVVCRRGDYQASEGSIHADDVKADLPAARAIVDAADDVIEHMPVFVPRR